MFAPSGLQDGKYSTSSLSPKSVVNVTTGISSLDIILGNGFPVGSLILIEEDEFGIYSDMFSKCFLSEGIVNSDSIFLANGNVNPQETIKGLPQAVQRIEDTSVTSPEELKIAWRYQKYQQVMSTPTFIKNLLLSHEFDFSSKLSEEIISQSDIVTWSKCFSENSHIGLLKELFNFIYLRKPSIKSTESRKFVSRICIQSLGSPFWLFDNQSMRKFLYQLRTIIHNSFSVGLVTIPTKLLQNEVVNNCREMSDIVISLKSFANDLSFTECNGLIKLLKISPLNTFSIYVPEDTDWAFKVKRKKLIIEKLHLPPEIAVTEQREQDDMTVSLPCQLNF